MDNQVLRKGFSQRTFSLAIAILDNYGIRLSSNHQNIYMFRMVTESLFAVRPRNIRFDIGVAVVGLVSIRVIIWLSLWKTPLPDNLQPLSTATLPLLVRKKNIITALSQKNYQRFAHHHMKVYSEKRNALLGHPTPRPNPNIYSLCFLCVTESRER